MKEHHLLQRAPAPNDLERQVDTLAVPRVLGIQRNQSFFQNLSLSARALFLAAAANIVALSGTAQAQTVPHEGRQQHAPARHEGHTHHGRHHDREHRHEGPRIEAEGFEQVYLGSEFFAHGLREAVSPLMDRSTYHLRFRRQQQTIPQSYFGISANHGRHQTAQPNVISLSDAEAYDRDDGSHAVDFFSLSLGRSGHDTRGLCVIAVHEIVHGLRNTHLDYFRRRVRSAERIPFSYTEHFVDSGQSGHRVRYEDMADEYRSTLVETLFSMQGLPEGMSYEDAAVQYIHDRYPQASLEVIREDVQDVMSWLEPGAWEQMHRRYRAFVRQVDNEFQRNFLQREILQRIEDPNLRQVLSDIAQRQTPTRMMRLLRLSGSRSDTELSDLIYEVREYVDEMTESHKTQLHDNFPNAAPFLSDWEHLVTAVNDHNDRELQLNGSLPLISSANADENFTNTIMVQLERIDVSRLNMEWRSFRTEERERLIGQLSSYTQFATWNVPLPGAYELRAATYL